MKDIRICFFGDSFVNGTGDPTYLGWTGRVCNAMVSSQPPQYNVTHYNLGIRGNTSEQIESRWQQEATRRLSPGCDARLVFSFGVNDNRIEAGTIVVEPEKSVACARRILSAAQRKYSVVFVGPPPVEDAAMNQRTAVNSAAYAELCESLAIPYLETYQPLIHNEVWMREVALIDGAHPAAAGYAAMANLIIQWPAWQAWFS